MKKWTLPIISLGLSVGLAASAAHGADKETLKMAAGTKGGQVIVYNIIFKPAQRKLNKAFNKKFAKYGIKAKMIRSQSGKIANLYKQELRAGKVRMDAISTADPGMFLSFNRKNQLTRYCSPHYKDYRDWAVAKDCGYFYHTSWLQYISYNPELVKGGDIPNSWLDFHKPKWKGKISFGDPKIGGGHYYFVFTMYKLFGRDWFIKSRDNNAMMVRSHGTTNNKVKSGERHFGVNLSMLVRRDGPYPGGKNAPIKEVFPKEGGALLVAPDGDHQGRPQPRRRESADRMAIEPRGPEGGFRQGQVFSAQGFHQRGGREALRPQIPLVGPERDGPDAGQMDQRLAQDTDRQLISLAG